MCCTLRILLVALQVIILQFFGVKQAFAYEIDIKTIKVPLSPTNPISNNIDIDNCDSNQPLPYNLEDKVSLSQTLSLERGWTVKPGLSVDVPGIGSIELGLELARKYGVSSKIDRETSQKLIQTVPPQTHIKYTVSVRETIAEGTVTITDGFLFWKKKETSGYSFVTKRDIGITPETISCFYGIWDYVAWDESPNRQGVGNVLYAVQPVHIQRESELKVDEDGTVIWQYWLEPRGGGGRTRLTCRGKLDDPLRLITLSNTNMFFPEHAWDISGREREEFTYALCGEGINYARGKSIRSYFRIRLNIENQATILQMDNSEGTLRWRKRK
jgi:hypothetical protein